MSAMVGSGRTSPKLQLRFLAAAVKELTRVMPTVLIIDLWNVLLMLLCYSVGGCMCVGGCIKKICLQLTHEI